jgi:AcrR family transcriptional regulator
MAHGTRDRILVATTLLFSRQGYNGTGVKQIVDRAKAPFGSVYHFFPGGKEELGAEVIRASGQTYVQVIDYVFADEPDVVKATRAFFRTAADALEEMDFADPCPIATVAMEISSTSEPLRAACAEAFESWIDRVASYLRRAGLTKAVARKLALSLLALLEGGFMIGRAFHDRAPVLTAGEQAASVVQAALDSRHAGRARSRTR